MNELKIEYVPIDSVKMYAKNAKLHPESQVEQIKKSITDYGMRDPIGVWNGEIVEGHGRYLACQQLGIDTIPIIRLDDMTDQQRREYMLVHNKTNMNSGFDFALLDEEIGELPDFDSEIYGFTTGVDEYVDGFFEDGVQANEQEESTTCKIVIEVQEDTKQELEDLLKENGYVYKVK